MGWIARGHLASETYDGGTIQPPEIFSNNLAIYFSTQNLNSIWKGSSVSVRAYWGWREGLIYTPWVRLSFNERNYISLEKLDAKAPFHIEFLVNADVNNYLLTIWEWEPVYSINSSDVTLNEEFIEVFPANFSRIDYQLINTGSDGIEFYWGDSSSNTAILPVGVEIIESGTKEVRSLNMRAIGGEAKAKIIERIAE